MFRFLLLSLCLLLAFTTQVQSQTITLGSKMDAEGRLLGEIFAQKLEADGFEVRRQLGLGSTSVTWQALQAGEIDLYPEYTGTLALSLLGLTSTPDLDELNKRLEPLVFRHCPLWVLTIPTP